MNQSSNFVQPSTLIDEHKSNRYYKALKTWEHFVAMMYAVMAGCTSLREIVLGLESFEGKLNHLNMGCIPARSILSDSNKHRSSSVFKGIYSHLYKRYKPSLSDSNLSKAILENLFLMDSMVFQLFNAITLPDSSALNTLILDASRNSKYEESAYNWNYRARWCIFS